MSDTLARIVDDKRKHVAARKQACSQAECETRAKGAEPPRGFAKALKVAIAAGRHGLIAEIKKASPSKGLIRPDFDPPSLAQAYERTGRKELARQAFQKADRKSVNLFQLTKSGARRLIAGADKRLAQALREDALTTDFTEGH